VEDARCVVLNAVDARARGAEVLTRCAVTAAQRGADPSAELALLGAMLAFAALVCPWIGGAAVAAAVES
jgi:glycerol-3-phosphate dehydrogenase